MRAKITPLEHLARAILWAEFGRGGKKGKTMDSYWNSVSPETRKALFKEAARLVWALRSVPARYVAAAVKAADTKARVERARRSYGAVQP